MNRILRIVQFGTFLSQKFRRCATGELEPLHGSLGGLEKNEHVFMMMGCLELIVSLGLLRSNLTLKLLHMHRQGTDPPSSNLGCSTSCHHQSRSIIRSND
jgi:hypothetical protein